MYLQGIKVITYKGMYLYVADDVLVLTLLYLEHSEGFSCDIYKVQAIIEDK